MQGQSWTGTQREADSPSCPWVPRAPAQEEGSCCETEGNGKLFALTDLMLFSRNLAKILICFWGKISRYCHGSLNGFISLTCLNFSESESHFFTFYDFFKKFWEGGRSYFYCVSPCCAGCRTLQSDLSRCWVVLSAPTHHRGLCSQSCAVLDWKRPLSSSIRVRPSCHRTGTYSPGSGTGSE